MTELPSFPFAVGPKSEPPAEYAAARSRPEPTRVRLANGREALLVTRYHDVRQVLSDARFSRSAYQGGSMYSRSTDSLPLAASDAPEHSRRRAAVAQAFTTRAVRGLRPLVAEVAGEQIAELATGPQPADLVAGFTVPFTLRVICRILGVPDADARLFKPLVDPMMSVDRYPAGEVARCHAELAEYFVGHVDRVRAELDAGRPTAGLVADLLTPRDPDRQLSGSEVVALSAGLLMAGYETTGNEMATAVYHLLRNPDLVGRLRREPDLIGQVVEETLRFICGNGTGGVPHVATAEVTLSDGVVIPAGAVVVPVPDAANRDEAVFEQPHCLRPDRTPNSHVAFGYGAHHCLGAELARLELRVGIGGLLAAFPELRIAVPDGELRWRTDMLVRGLWELPVRWLP